jgi:hypothetical protein
MASCDKRGPLSRAGHAQPDRTLAERDPGYFKLDERDTADLILFARRFARHLRYYDGNNAEAGDWSAYFDNDISTTLASLMKAPVEPFRKALADVRKFLEDDPARPEAVLRSHLGLLFQLPLALYRDVAARQSALETDHRLYPVLQQIAARNLGPALTELVQYHRGAVDAGLIANAPLDPLDFKTTDNAGPGPRLLDEIAALLLPPPPDDVAFADTLIAPRAIQSFAPTGWPDFYTAQSSDPAPFADGTTVYERIFDALNYNLLVSAMERVFQAMARTQLEAEVHLRGSLESFAAHRPHYGLWLAFLSMFDKARDELSDFTGRHLDFYYEEILRLSRRGPVPDHVHVLCELTRGREAHLLSAGAELRGGKDALGREVTYTLDDDIVVNRGRVAELRGVRVDETRFLGLSSVTVRGSCVLASADGIGEEDLPPDAPHFAPFGPDTAPFARVGFAVSDRQLFQRDGKRTILLSFTQPAPGFLLNFPGFTARLTTEDGWLDLNADPEFQAALVFGRLWFIVELDGGHPPIVPADPEIHGPHYDTGAPVMEVLVDFDDTPSVSSLVYAFLRDLERGPCLLRTSGTGQRLMAIKTEQGTADPAAKFMPFGPQPRKGAQWIIGSSELFSRELDSVTLHVSWAKRYNDSDYFRAVSAASYSASFDYLVGGTWTTGSATPSSLALGASGTATISAKGVSAAASDASLVAEDAPFDAQARSGFMRMTLNEDFGHSLFLNVKTQALIAKAYPELGYSVPSQFNDDANGLPLDPYVPEIAEISLSYSSTEREAAHCFRIHPFGVERADGAGRLFPDLDYSGALFIGVDALEPPERLSLFIQVADGTGDPLLEPPELEYAWLGANGWESFGNQEIDDRTTALAASGVLSFAVPQAAVTTSTLMPGARHWLRITAPDNGAAVNRLLSVDAQAVRATFVDRGNDPAFLETPLPAGTIAKLRVPDPAIKRLSQPYASFGGRGQEDRLAYHRRASERLRHKDRAVTMWDYEHLMLEAQTQVYRAKALNHTELVRQDGVVVGDNELSPGAVTVVAVPYTEGRDHLNPLRPYADRRTLEAIAETLGKRCSPFVRLEAANPKFEEVHVELNVAFLPGIADTDFYRAKIEAALIDHLTPWRRRDALGAEFNGRVYKSSVINFVEELPFVDYLQDVRLYHRPNPEVAAWTKVDAEIVRAKTARSILVSAPTHVIGLV